MSGAVAAATAVATGDPVSVPDGATGGRLSAASGAEVMAQCYLRNRKLRIRPEVVTVTTVPPGQIRIRVG
ncbi:hypothetical protein GCM10010341_00180 [Streptomyces noursei]|nr:hypothetical protein GCM10010341_00180 [Streptomyces noursei]